MRVVSRHRHLLPAERVKMCDITDGTSNTYMLGEKYLNSDHYFDGTDRADNETMYSGYDNDNHRTTYYQNENPPSHTPMQDKSGFTDCYRFGSATPTAATWPSATARCKSISYSIDPLGPTAVWATARTACRSTARSSNRHLLRINPQWEQIW